MTGLTVQTGGGGEAVKDTGMARKVDDLGRIVLPVELRRLHGIKTGDALDIAVDGDAIILRKVQNACVFCGSTDRLRIHRDRAVCASCLSELTGAAEGQPRTPSDGPT